MQPVPFTVRVASGSGLVAHFGDVVAYTAANDDPAALLLAAIAAAARNPLAGAVLADQLGPIALGEARRVSFGVVAPSAEGTHLILRGSVTARVETQQGLRELSGDSDPRLVSQLLPGQFRKIELFDSRSAVTVVPRTDLRAGLVGGGGFLLLGAASAPTVAGPEPEETERISSSPKLAPTQVVPRAAAVVETASPSASAGVLSTPDGAVYLLDRPYVVGRAPLHDDTVRDSTATPIVLDYDPYISRVHAYITVERGGVYVRDALTPAGTFIAAPGAAEWNQIGKESTKLEPGWSIRIGEWIATYRTGPGP